MESDEKYQIHETGCQYNLGLIAMIEKSTQVWSSILPFPTLGVSRGFASSKGGRMGTNDSTN